MVLLSQRMRTFVLESMKLQEKRLAKILLTI